MSKLFKIVSWVTISAAIILLGILIYWYTYPYKPITFDPLPLKIINKEVKGGAYVFYEVSFCKNSKIIPLITKTFIDGILYVTPQAVAINNPIGCQTHTVQNYVPEALPPGEYVIEISYEYQMNPIRKINISIKTDTFSVIK